jgi:hypothetical protein
VNSLNGSVYLPPSKREGETAFERGWFVANGPLAHGTAPSVSSVLGSELTSQDYAELEARWIDRMLAIQAGFRRVDSITGAEIVRRKGGNYSGIVIPYFRPGSNHVREHRLRRDHPDLECDSAGNLKPRQRYLSPPGRSNMLYVARHRPGPSPRQEHPRRSHRG